MVQFNYLAKNLEGKQKKGRIKARTQREAYGRLREQHLRALTIEEAPETFWTKDFSFDGKLKQRDFVIYLRQFATLMKAGVTIVDATSILAQQTESKLLKKILVEIELDLREGASLSQSYEKYPKLFKPLFTNMILAGEASGTIDETLERLADYYEKQFRLRQKIVSALTYPAILSILTVGVVAFLLIFVVPTFVDMFADLDAELPGITVFVLNLSEGLQKYWWLILLSALAIYIGLIMVKKSEKGRYFLDTTLLKLPVFGKLLQKSAIARMTSTLASLFVSSVPALQSMDIAEKVVENEVIAKVLREGKGALERGDSLTIPMRNHWAFPPLVTQMLVIGEQTGSPDAMLAEVASFYEAEVEVVTDQLKALIEPLMILVLASVVGVIVLAIMVPMFEMFNNI